MTEPKTIIGTSTVVNGNVEGDEILVVEGRVEGAVSLSKTLVVEPGGVVQADVGVESAIIRGALEGNIRAESFVQIEAGGRVIGDITAPRVILEDGAAFKGGIDMGDFEIEPAEAPARVEVAPPPERIPPAAKTPEPRVSKRPHPRSRTSMLSKPAATPSRSMAPVPRVRSIGRARAKKKGV